MYTSLTDTVYVPVSAVNLLINPWWISNIYLKYLRLEVIGEWTISGGANPLLITRTASLHVDEQKMINITTIKLSATSPLILEERFIGWYMSAKPWNGRISVLYSTNWKYIEQNIILQKWTPSGTRRRWKENSKIFT